MFKRFTHWIYVIAVKAGYVVSHPQVLWHERCEEARAHMWAREMAKKNK